MPGILKGSFSAKNCNNTGGGTQNHNHEDHFFPLSALKHYNAHLSKHHLVIDSVRLVLISLFFDNTSNLTLVC